MCWGGGILGSQNEIQILDVTDEIHFDAIKNLTDNPRRGFQGICLVFQRNKEGRLCVLLNLDGWKGRVVQPLHMVLVLFASFVVFLV